jgi:hypothetical protein
VTQLRSRAALRRKRGKAGKFDSKGTIRSNQRYGGVPMELKFKRKKLKPSLVLICDISRSMLAVAEFMLRLTYELQDQVAKTRSFGFYSDMEEISRPSPTTAPATPSKWSRTPSTAAHRSTTPPTWAQSGDVPGTTGSTPSTTGRRS